VDNVTPMHARVLRDIAGNVYALRTRAGLTQEALAERAELAPRYLQRIERASVALSVVVLVQLARALEVPPSRLLRPSKAPPPPKVGRPRKPRT
jgi:transcriptional regulator with XRE-family HTH domain